MRLIYQKFITRLWFFRFNLNWETADESLESLESIKIQSLKPKNVFIVIEGSMREKVRSELEQYKKVLPIYTVPISENKGLGIALREGLKEWNQKLFKDLM